MPVAAIMPVTAIVAGAIEAAKLAMEIIEAHNNGMSQDDLNKKWAAMQNSLRGHNAAWEAAGKP